MDIKLSELLNESNLIRIDFLDEIKLTIENIKNINEAIEDTNKIISDISISNETENKKKELRYEVIEYKSTLLQLKSDTEQTLENLKNELANNNKIISLIEKAIQLNVGDIF